MRNRWRIESGSTGFIDAVMGLDGVGRGGPFQSKFSIDFIVCLSVLWDEVGGGGGGARPIC